MLKKFYKFLFVFLLLVLLVYVSNVLNIPNKVIVYKNDDLNIKTLYGISIEKNQNLKSKEFIQAISDNEKLEKAKYNVKLFNFVVKQIDASIIEKTKVIPLGNLVGIKLYSNGVVVVGMSDIDGKKPYIDSGIIEGDRIVKVNEKNINNAKELIACISQSNGENIKINYIRNNELHTTWLSPVKSDSNEYKVGLWVKDTAGGVGTLSFFNEKNEMIASLGHAIVDADTGEKINISKGKFTATNIVNVIKGKEGNPGKIQGSIDNQEEIGEIYANTDFGVFGKIKNINLKDRKSYELALRNEIKIGDAEIICSIKSGEIKKYKIKIESIFYNNNENNKSMLVKITDKNLLHDTGGIVQGMSGSPIIQNDKFIGVLTHVLVSDSTTGYAVFGDLMIKQMDELDLNN